MNRGSSARNPLLCLPLLLRSSRGYWSPRKELCCDRDNLSYDISLLEKGLPSLSVSPLLLALQLTSLAYPAQRPCYCRIQLRTTTRIFLKGYIRHTFYGSVQKTLVVLSLLK